MQERKEQKGYTLTAVVNTQSLVHTNTQSLIPPHTKYKYVRDKSTQSHISVRSIVFLK